jgi:hypothetical protein
MIMKPYTESPMFKIEFPKLDIFSKFNYPYAAYKNKHTNVSRAGQEASHNINARASVAS